MEHQKTLGVVGYVYYLDCGEDIMGICICPNSFICTHQKCYSLYTNYNSINLFLNRVHQLSKRHEEHVPGFIAEEKVDGSVLQRLAPDTGPMLTSAKPVCAMHLGKYGLRRNFFIASKLRKLTLIQDLFLYYSFIF